MKTRISSGFFVLARAGLALAAAGDAPGKQEFMTDCATCHGAAGRGEGQCADLMKTAAPDPTTMPQRNQGVFAPLEGIHIIDGRSGMRAHGGETPPWGDRFEATAEHGVAGDYGTVYGARVRVLSVAHCLASIRQ